MKLVPYMSYWTNGYAANPSPFIINLHKLSSYFLLKNFGEVHFITDTKGAEIFKDIKWTSVSEGLNEVDSKYSQTWSISKLYAYGQIAEKKQPFIHVDYDVFLYEGIGNISNSAIFAQSPENAVNYFYEIEKLERHCPNLHIINNSKPEYAVNVGVIGGHDTDFIRKYSKSAIQFVEDPSNQDFWTHYHGFKHNQWTKAVIAEQYYLSAIAEFYDKKIDFVFPNGWPSNEEAMAKKYTHLMGAKNQYGISEKIENLVQKLNL